MTPFETALASPETINVNGKPMSYGIYNLIITKRDLSLWTKIGMKPTRTWSVTPVKKYFGITGNGQALMDNFMKLYNKHLPS